MLHGLGKNGKAAGMRPPGFSSSSVLLPERLAAATFDRPLCTFGTQTIELLQSYIRAQS